MTILENNIEWINERAATNPTMSVEQISEWFSESVEALKAVGLDKALGGEDSVDFVEMVKTATVGKIQGNLAVEPTEFQMMILGPYPERFINKKSSVEMICFASQDGNNPELSRLNAWDTFTPSKNDVEPLTSYQTGVSFFEDDRELEPNTFKLTVQKATKFTNDNKCDFMYQTYDERLEAIRTIVPKVNLGEATQNLSKTTQNVKSGKSYPNSLDLKRIIVQVVGTADGVDKNGREWAMFHVVDGTFEPTIKVKHIAVWVDPSIYNKIQAGPGSMLEIYGMLQKRDDEEVASMSACFVNALLTKPMEIKNKPQTDQVLNVVQTPDESQIKVMCTSDGM